MNRQYLYIYRAAYEAVQTPFPPEFETCFGEIYDEPADENTLGVKLTNYSLKTYLDKIGHPGGDIKDVDVDGVPFVIIPIPWDRSLGDIDDIIAAKAALNPMFAAQETDWSKCWLSGVEARLIIEKYKPVIDPELI
jgi:hypothetical protein